MEASAFAWFRLHTTLDWNDMATLLAIHDCGSLSAAARAMGVSQSTMSRRLAALEASGHRIFSRNADGALHLLPAGEPILAAARSMEAAFRGATETITSPAPLRIAACEVTARLYLSEVLSQWAAKSDRTVDLAVYEDLFNLPANAWDILVTPADGSFEAMEGIRIGIMDFGMFAARSYLEFNPFIPGSNNLNGHKVIGASGSLAHVSAWTWLANQGGTIAFTASSVMAQLEAMARGLGVAILPAAIVNSDDRIVRLDYPTPPPAEVWMLVTHASSGLRHIADFLRWGRRHFAK